MGLAAGVIASVVAALALMVRGDYRGLDEQEVFNQTVLATGEDEKNDGAVVYKLHLANHL